MIAARSRPRSEPANSNDFRPRAMPRSAGIIGQADSPVIEESGEGLDPLQHVVHGLGDLVCRKSLVHSAVIQAMSLRTMGAISARRTVKRRLGDKPLIVRSPAADAGSAPRHRRAWPAPRSAPPLGHPYCRGTDGSSRHACVCAKIRAIRRSQAAT